MNTRPWCFTWELAHLEESISRQIAVLDERIKEAKRRRRSTGAASMQKIQSQLYSAMTVFCRWNIIQVEATRTSWLQDTNTTQVWVDEMIIFEEYDFKAVSFIRVWKRAGTSLG